MLIFKKELAKEWINSKLGKFLCAIRQKLESKKFVVEALKLFFWVSLLYFSLSLFVPSLPMHKALVEHPTLVLVGLFSSYFILWIFIPSLPMPNALAKYYSLISKSLKGCGLYIWQKLKSGKLFINILTILFLACLAYFILWIFIPSLPMPKGMLNEIPEGMLKGVLKVMPEGMLKGMLKGVLKVMPEGMLEAQYLGAGIIAVLGILLSARRSLAAEKQNKIQEEQNKIQRESIESTAKPERERGYNEAISNLGAIENIAKRIAAMFSLEKLMREKPEDYHKIAFSALRYYLKNNAEECGDPEKTSAKDGSFKAVSADVQTCLEIIANRKVRSDEGNLDLANLSFSKCKLPSANFKGAFLQRANFNESFLEKANFNEAYLRETKFNKAILMEANFNKAFLYKAILDVADLQKAKLERANLSEASLVRAQLHGAKLDGANLYKANFNGASLHEASLVGANLMEAKLERVGLNRAKLEGAELYRARLNGSYLHEANLKGANLRWANLEGVKLEEANLEGADLQGANLEGTNLSGANLKEANLFKASLVRVNLWGARSLKEVQLSLAKEVREIILPNGDWLKDKEQLKNYEGDLSRKKGYKPPPFPPDHTFNNNLISLKISHDDI